MKHKRRSFIIPFLVMFFCTYGIVSVYQDWLARPISRACEYIDGMGVVFWVCLVVAGVVVWVGNRVMRRRDANTIP